MRRTSFILTVGIALGTAAGLVRGQQTTTPPTLHFPTWPAESTGSRPGAGFVTSPEEEGPGFTPPATTPVRPVSARFDAPPPQPATSPPTVPPTALPQPAPFQLPAVPSAAPVVEKSATEQKHVGQVAAFVEVETVCPETIGAGDPLPCEVLVRNAGRVTVYQARLHVALPAECRFLGSEPTADQPGEQLHWNLGTLEPGELRRVKFRLQPGSDGPVQTAAAVTFSTMAPVRTKIAKPRLGVTMTGPETARVGDPVAFVIQVTNLGTGTATNVVLRDTLPEGLSHPQGPVIEADLGTMPPGASRTVNLKTTAIRSGPQVNVVTAVGDGGVEAKSQAAVRLTEARLEIKLASVASLPMREEADAWVEVSNPGTASAPNVRLLVQMPEGLDAIAADQGGTYDPAARSVRWPLGDLEAGARKRLALKVRGRLVGAWMLRGTATTDSGPDGLTVRGETPIKVEGVPTLLLEAVDLDDPLAVGKETNYELRVANQGTCNCSNLKLLATVPEHMILRGAAGPVPYRVEGRQVIFEPLPSLAMQSDALYRVRVRAVRSGEAVLQLTLTADEIQQPLRRDETTRVVPE